MSGVHTFSSKIDICQPLRIILYTYQNRANVLCDHDSKAEKETNVNVNFIIT